MKIRGQRDDETVSEEQVEETGENKEQEQQ